MKWIPSEAQILAYNHLEKTHALLLMGCGLGKTATVLHKFYDLLCDGATRGMLVIAPIRVCNLTWPDELVQWGLTDMRMANLRTDEGKEALLKDRAEIFLINYEALPKFKDWYLFGKRGKYPFDTICWDETTFAKNHKSNRINSVREYFHKKCKRHWGMTGTPAPNGLLDLFAQARLIDNGIALGRSFSHYRDTYFEAKDYNRYYWELQDGARERIYGRLSNLAISLKSSDYLDIPDICIEDVIIQLNTKEQAAYDELEEEFLLELDDGIIEAKSAGVLANKLAQCSSGAIYDEERVVKNLHNHKIKKLKTILNKHKNEQVLIVYQYKHEADRIRKNFSNCRFFSEATTKQKQKSLLQDWNNNKIGLLAVHPASVGHGLNMQGGSSTMVWTTPTWNKEHYEQTIRRLARRGQSEVTTVYRILCSNTIDDAIVTAIGRKTKEENNLLDAIRDYRKTKKV